MPLLSFLNQQLRQLRRLAQPYFLPLDQGGWPLLGLLLALVAIAAALTLVLITAVVQSLPHLLPASTLPLLLGSRQRLVSIWHLPLLPALAAPALLAVALLVWGCQPGARLRRPWLWLLAAGLLVVCLALGPMPLPPMAATAPPMVTRWRLIWQQPRIPAGPLLLGLAAAGVGCLVFWRRHLRQGRWLPWLLMGLVIWLILLINSINVGISFIARDIDNSLVAFHREDFWTGVLIYAGCLVLALPIRGVQSYLVPRFGLLWRQWLSDQLLQHFLSDRVYYRLGADPQAAHAIDNPDQRISEDAASFTTASLTFAVDVITALLTFLSFIVVLWAISGRLALWLLIYAAIGTALVAIASRRLVVLNGDQLRLNADFRYGLVHIRNHAESIAFYRGEPPERREALRRLQLAIRNQDRLIIWEALITVIQTSYDYFSDFLPWLVLAPLYFSHRIDFGVIGQAGIAFSQVLASISYIVNNIDQLAAFSAAIQRLETFQGAMAAESARVAAAASASGLSPIPVAGPDSNPPSAPSILLRHVDLIPPGSERLLVRDLSLEVAARQRLLVVGPSGCGKTSFLRLVSGLWPSEAGAVQRPEAGELLFIPQKPYMLLGSLREQLCYPQPTDRFSDEQLRHVLEQVRLGELVQRYPDLSIKQDWPRLLSLGEQQRLAFARLLLAAPRFVVLDEATSALDVPTERLLYGLLAERDTAFVSVGHRPTLLPFHDTVLELDGNGAWRLIPASSWTPGR